MDGGPKVEVPLDLLKEVLDTAESNSFLAEMEWASNTEDHARYSAQQEKIAQLRQLAGIEDDETE